MTRDTLATYEAHVAEYVAETTTSINWSMNRWFDVALYGLDETAKIFEIGSATGRDAAHFHTRGYQVQTSDATKGFVEMLRGQGLDAIQFNVLEDEFPDSYDLIIANAVYLHFTHAQFDKALVDTINALKPGGRFAFSLKEGVGNKWSKEKLGAPRYFQYYSGHEMLRKLSLLGLEHHIFCDGGWIHVVTGVELPEFPAHLVTHQLDTANVRR